MARLSSSALLLVGVVTAVPRRSGGGGGGERGCPETCPDSSQPVCGSNGVVFRNECYLNRAACTTFPSLRKRHDGPCVSDGERPKKCKEECTKIYLPVCGTDGKTYNNKCILDFANCKNNTNIEVLYENPCEAEEVTDICRRECSDAYEPACGTDRTTYYNKCELSIAMCRDRRLGLEHDGTCDNCTGGFRPVCGTNDLTYGSDCYLKVAMCRNSGGLQKKADGVCTKDCTLQCDTARDLVCASDGITYTNYCFLLLASCKDPAVKFRNRGRCVFIEKSECGQRRCPERWQPLCGSDGVTYDNKCRFDAAACRNQGLLKLNDGVCQPEPRRCGRCEDNTRRLVCGNDGVTYLNHCHLILHACRSGRDIAKWSDGPCLRY